MDEKIVLVGVRADGIRFFYDYTVNDVEDLGDQDTLIDVLHPMVARNVCNRIDMVQAMGYGAHYIYSYRFEDGAEIGSFELGEVACLAAVSP